MRQGPSAAVIVAFALALLAPGLPARVLNYHEARYALAAREMASSGNWLVPTLLGAPRLRKPPLTYWAIAASLTVFRSRAEWAVRVPSIVAATAVALLIARLTARWLGAPLGLFAGLVQLSSVYVIVQSGLADPDMLLCATVTAAFAALFAAIDPAKDRPSRATRLAFHLAVGLSFLAKGPIGPAFVVAPAAICLATERYRARVGALVLDPLGLLVLVGVAAAWPALVLPRHPGAVHEWVTENVGRFEGELGSESVFFYLYTIPLIAMPWTPLAARGAWRALRDHAAGKAPLLPLASWFAVGVALLSASAGKHDRYAAPILPPLAVFAAMGIADLVPRLPRWTIAAALGTIWMATVSIQWRVVPTRQDRYREQAECARRFDARSARDDVVYLVGIPYNRRVQLAYYLNASARAAESVDEVARGSMVVGPREAVEQRTAETLDRCEMSDGTLVLARITAR